MGALRRRRRTLAGGPELFVHAVEDAVDEPARFLRAELLRDLDRLVDHDPGRRLAHPQELEDTLSENVAVDDGHPVDVPVLRVLRDHLVDLPLVQLRAPHQGFAEFPRVRVHRMPGPELVEMRLGIALALHVELVQELERNLARLSSTTHSYPRRVAPPVF